MSISTRSRYETCDNGKTLLVRLKPGEDRATVLANILISFYEVVIYTEEPASYWEIERAGRDSETLD